MYQSEAYKFLKHSEGEYDLVFLDPPFELDEWQNVMEEVARPGLLNKRGMVVAEHRFNFDLEDSYGMIHRINNKTYGDSKIAIYEVVSG